MKFKLLLTTATGAVLLTACDQINQYTQSVPDPSPEQARVAQIAYDHLTRAEFEQLTENFAPELKTKFAQNNKVLKKFAQDLPQQAYQSKKIVAKHLDHSKTHPARYTVSYEYAYPKNLVQYDVSFDPADHQNKIRDINIQIFGE
ncbi:MULTISPECIES: DUF3887 domain-containing protein [unclassified Acinetobacter]|uniref:DUF3887 domain-containing protein n=1 Tax=unclassified Acinetobacter TaxID=196816 RepID=UPI0029344FD5|nr:MULTISPECIES: DUF3887 domain-containing protein [unclassified Acinetobacter]WOE31475.1 DUF3887 domain-containing protein [Acinetobacter sp. SAAs470]WOE39671.1 DUF3887 domain-containing protein [Acinetobacter sp. SAAs474]